MNAPDPLRLLAAGLRTKRQVAERLQVSVRTVERLVRAGELTPCQIGRAVRFSERQIEAYLRAHTERRAG